jgi:hypothetical protein
MAAAQTIGGEFGVGAIGGNAGRFRALMSVRAAFAAEGHSFLGE